MATQKEQKTTIYSMASCDCVVARYKAKEDKKSVGANVIEKAIIIKGGANVSNPVTMNTPKFVTTEVTPDELEILKASKPFMRKVDKGFITIGNPPAEKKSDKSAQLTKSQVKSKAPKAKVKTSSDSEE